MVSRPISNSNTPVYKVGSSHAPKRKLTLSIDNGQTGTTKEITLPLFGEVRIITHGGKITFIETTEKEKVE